MGSTRSWVVAMALAPASLACQAAGDGEELPVEINDEEAEPTEELETRSEHPGPCLIERTRVSDGYVLMRDHRQYDDEGRLTLRELDLADETGAADGVIDRDDRRIYDYGGLQLRQEQDLDHDGEVDWIRVWHRDPATGNTLSYETDGNADGTFDSVWHHTWQDGQMVLKTYESYSSATVHLEYFDRHVDGPFQGQVETREYDRLGDGTIERVLSYDYEDDGEGGVRTTFLDYDQQGFSLSAGTTGITAAEVDGAIDASVEYLYSDDGYLIEKRWNEDPEGSPQIEVREQLFYECE